MQSERGQLDRRFQPGLLVEAPAPADPGHLPGLAGFDLEAVGHHRQLEHGGQMCHDLVAPTRADRQHGGGAHRLDQLRQCITPGRRGVVGQLVVVDLMHCGGAVLGELVDERVAGGTDRDRSHRRVECPDGGQPLEGRIGDLAAIVVDEVQSAHTTPILSSTSTTAGAAAALSPRNSVGVS